MKKFILTCLVVATLVTVQVPVVGDVKPAVDNPPASSPTQTPSPSKAVAVALDAVNQKTLAEISQWEGVLRQVETLMLEPDTQLRATAGRVVASLRAELAARQDLHKADLAVLTANARQAQQPIYSVRPYNDFTAECNYADKMQGIHESWMKNSVQARERARQIAENMKKAASGDATQIARIDDWQKLLDDESALVGSLIGLYDTRSQPGWYDRACLADKFDLIMLRIREAAARRGIKPGLHEALLEAQTQAALAVLQAAKTSYQAMADFNALMTRESPQISAAAAPAEAIPSQIWNFEQLSKKPLFRWLDDKEPVRQLLYRGESYQGKPVDVFAYYATPGTLASNPALDKNLPALVLIHGGGDRASRDWVVFWAKKGYAAMSMDLAGCGPNIKGEYDRLFKLERLLRGGPGQDGNRKILDVDLPLTDQWPYHSVANVILAHSLIRSLPGIDPERTAVAGISWGGYLTCIVAGVDSRFKAAMPFYGCGFLAENSVWKDNGLFEKLTADQRERWTQLWDPSKYASQITMPLFAVTGANDFAYPMESFGKTYALAEGPRWFRITPDMGHGGQFLTSTPEAVAFMDNILRGGAPLLSVGTPKVGPEGLSAKVSGGEIASAQFHYTTAQGPNKSRAWVTVNAGIHGELLTATPPGDMAVGYFTVTDRKNQTTSSEPILAH